jgi:hypothetical protein
MITLRIDDAYGSAVVIALLRHEDAAVVDVVHEQDMHDLFLDSQDLRDLSRAALLAADELDRWKKVGK